MKLPNKTESIDQNNFPPQRRDIPSQMPLSEVDKVIMPEFGKSRRQVMTPK
jgi:hypothetical protein